MTTPTSMGNHGGTVMSCSPYAHPGFAEICILHRTWSTVTLGTYELAFLIKKKDEHPQGQNAQRIQGPENTVGKQAPTYVMDNFRQVHPAKLFSFLSARNVKH